MAYYEEDDLGRFAEVGKHRPDLFEKFMTWYQACLEAGSNMEQMTEAIHMASALRGGASLIHGLQAHNSVNKVSM